MRRLLLVTPALALFAVAMMAVSSGCGKPTEKPATDATKKPDATDATPKAGGPKTAIKAGDGVIKGKIVFAGTAPGGELIPNLNDPKYKSCVSKNKNENTDQLWIIGENKGVANVVIYLKAAGDKYFEASEADKKRSDTVEVDQPHCAFLPHVSAVFPYYLTDGKNMEKTGQVFKVKNSFSDAHNTKAEGNPLHKVNNFDVTVSPSKSTEGMVFIPQKDPIKISCTVHPWMSARVWVFDHPYFAVTKEDGTFEIKNVPVETKLQLEIWHEGPKVFKMETIELKKGSAPHDLGEVPVK